VTALFLITVGALFTGWTFRIAFLIKEELL